MRSLTLKQVANLLHCSGFFPEIPIRGVCVDSRLLKTGELFFALKGAKVDGHDFLDEARKRGAIGAVVANDYCQEREGFFFLKVENPLHALQELARLILLDMPVRIVAVTGSIGKTSTKEFIRTLLSTHYRVAASPGNSNSQIGVPLAILNHTDGKEDILVLEMGMTIPGQIERLVEIAPPEIALITTVALVHACNFDSLQDIARAKAEIFSHPSTRFGILPHDAPFFPEMEKVGKCQKISFSVNSLEADYGLYPSGDAGSHLLRAYKEAEEVTLGPIPIPGKHNLHNLLGAITVARYFKIDWEDIKRAISSLALPERRLQFVRHQGILFLNDSYNASELSVKAALETLPSPGAKGKKVAVLGSMLELGKFSYDCHYRVGEHALKYVEQMYCLGEECLPIVEVWKKAKRSVNFFHHRTDLVASLKKDLQSGDVVLLKGSRSKELWKVLDEL